ncbi:hypothetical protein IAI10_02020 [Clostridium sp. 19966]|uniref:hypothetical protein n=1 Tax=Clostridium sp. 19966 TaxID=2768166 RepID=UPI0028DEA1D6|nr:hypothetical protein [Clostridium sp. 19966]MDT8715433.1 hypothetical protein [Clostridium sp. 19966]
MNISEVTTLNGNITVKDANGNPVQVGYLSATLNTDSQAFNINMSVQNKDLLTANAADVQSQYSAFETAVKSRAKELGYVIFG